MAVSDLLPPLTQTLAPTSTPADDLPDPRVGPAHDVFATLAGLAAGGAEAPVGLVVLGEADLVRLRARPGTGVSVPVHGTPRLRSVLAHLATTTDRLVLADLGGIEWAADAGHADLCGVRALALTPVRQGSRVVGVVGAADTLSRPWSADELAHLGEVAAVVEHELSTRARVVVAERVLRGWDAVTVGVDGAGRATGTLLEAVEATGEPALRARGALVRDRLDALGADVLRLETELAPGRDALTALAPVDLRVGVTAAVRAVATTRPGARVRPRLHAEPVWALADHTALRAGVLALLHVATSGSGDEDVLVSLDLVPGSGDEVSRGPVARLRVHAPGRTCDASSLAAAVGRFESLVRRPGHAPASDTPTLRATGGVVEVRGRSVTAAADSRGIRVETTWRVDLG